MKKKTQLFYTLALYLIFIGISACTKEKNLNISNDKIINEALLIKDTNFNEYMILLNQLNAQFPYFDKGKTKEEKAIFFKVLKKIVDEKQVHLLTAKEKASFLGFKSEYIMHKHFEALSKRKQKLDEMFPPLKNVKVEHKNIINTSFNLIKVNLPWFFFYDTEHGFVSINRQSLLEKLSKSQSVRGNSECIEAPFCFTEYDCNKDCNTNGIPDCIDPWAYWCSLDPATGNASCCTQAQSNYTANIQKAYSDYNFELQNRIGNCWDYSLNQLDEQCVIEATIQAQIMLVSNLITIREIAINACSPNCVIN